MGLRELKKEQTRLLIAETAWRLFSKRGFDNVTVAEVARQAQVATATVFNYFPAKEDLVFSSIDAFADRLVTAVAHREPGISVLAAVRTFMHESTGLLHKVELGDADALDRVRAVNQVIASSPTLQARDRQASARCTDALARLLLDEPGTQHDEVTARVVANALIGVHQALLAMVRRRIFADDRPEALAADIRGAITRAFALLERGLAGHEIRNPAVQHNSIQLIRDE